MDLIFSPKLQSHSLLSYFIIGFESVSFCFHIGVVRRKRATRHLWDKTPDRWEHDLYREEEQGPKRKEELEVRSHKSIIYK